MLRRTHHRQAEQGAIYIEVLLALMPLLISFLGITQLALLHMGQLVVTHAAGRAVRAAVVVLDDDPDYYGGAARYNLDDGAARDQEGIIKVLGNLNDAYSGLTAGAEVQGGARLTAIREAAYHPLSVLAPPATELGGDHPMQEEVGGSPWLRVALVSIPYNRAAASISLTSPSGPRSPVTVRVNYLMACGVPLVSAMMCSSGRTLLASRLLPASAYEEKVTAAMGNVASPLLRDALLASGGHYRLITAEATLPNQGAEYHKK